MRKLNMLFLILMVVGSLIGISVTDTLASDTLSTVWKITADDASDNIIGMSGMTRSAAYCKANNHIYVARRSYDSTRTVLPAIAVYDASTGEYIKNLNITGISDHTYPLNSVAVTEDGQIFVCNLNHPGNRAFRIWRYASETSAPTKIVDDTTVNMTTGEVMSVYGTGKNLEIYASGSGSFKVYKWATTNGTSYTKSTAISLPIAGYAGSAIAKVSSNYFFIAGNRQPVRFIKVINGGSYETIHTFPRTMLNAVMTYFEVPTEDETTRRFLALGKGYTPGMTLVELKGEVGENLCDGNEVLDVAVPQYAHNVNLSASGQIAYDVRNNQLIELVSNNGLAVYDFDQVVSNPTLMPQPVISPSTMAFGNVATGNSSQLLLSVTNLNGTGKVKINSVTITNDAFTTTLQPGTVINAGEAILGVTVTFTPQNENFITATMTVVTNAGTFNITLTGRGKTFKITKSLAITDEVIYENAPAKGLIFRGGSISEDGQIIWFCGQKTSSKQTYVFRSIDGGQTFSTFGPIANRPANMYGFDENEAVLTTTACIYRTTDGGATWTNVHTYTGAFFDGMAAVGDGILVAIGDGPTAADGDVYLCRSEDHGATWTRLEGIDYKEASIAIYTEGCTMSSYENTVWAASCNGAYTKPFIHKSTDDGLTWVTLAPDAVAAEIKDIRAMAFADDNNGMFVVRRKSDGKRVVYATTDGGESWHNVAVPADALPNAISVIPNAGVFVLGCDSTKAYYTTDLGSSWSKISVAEGAGINKLLGSLIKDADFGYVFSQEGNLLKLKAEAKTTKLWEKAPGSLSFFKNDHCTRGISYNAATDHLLVASRSDSSLVRVIDAATGDPLFSLATPEGGFTGGTYYINLPRADANGVIYVCNLTTSGTGLKIYRYADETAIPTVAFAGDVSGRVGDAFTLVGEGTETVLYISGSSNTKIHRFVTTDGESFTLDGSITVGTGLARGGISVVTDAENEEFWVNGAGTATSHIDGTGAVLAAMNTGIVSSGWHNVLYIPDGAQKLVALVGKNDATQGNRVVLYDVSSSETDPWIYDSLVQAATYNANTNATGDMCYKNNGDGSITLFYVITNNAIAAWKLNIGGPAGFLAKDANDQFQAVSVNKTTVLNQNYPNPFNPTTTIEFTLKQNGFVSLSVYNLMGQEVCKLVEGELSAGTHKVQFDAGRFSTGVYLYRLTTPDYTNSKKMMLVK